MGKGDIAGRMVRLEAAALLVLIVVVYGQRDASWLLFATLFLAPDVSALGYLVSPRAGAIGYNLGHTLVFPVLLGLAGLVAGAPLPVTLALIWPPTSPSTGPSATASRTWATRGIPPVHLVCPQEMIYPSRWWQVPDRSD